MSAIFASCIKLMYSSFDKINKNISKIQKLLFPSILPKAVELIITHLLLH